MKPITRRDFLRAVGGVTFLALAPNGQGLFAAEAASLPLFTVLPYIQPGASSRLLDGKDTLIVSWQTEHRPADFEVTYGLAKTYDRSANVSVSERVTGRAPNNVSPADQQFAADNYIVRERFNYSANLSNLALDSKYFYRVRANGLVIAEGYASTRKARGRKIRFAAFGDNSFGDMSDRAIAYHAYMAKPDFVMNTGDNVYDTGLDSEYARYFFPVYNADVAGLHIGAPLLRSVPFYTVLANHDINGRDASGGPAADFDVARDALGYYTAMHLPLNGLEQPPSPTPTVCSHPAVLGQFLDCAGLRFPRMANYSFDFGDAHFLCLDSNTYVDMTDPLLGQWIDSDLSGSDARWKFVVYHHPAFNVGEEHYDEQQMRVIAPILQNNGVDMVFSGHEHTYQRTQPIKFEPYESPGPRDIRRDHKVPGAFAVDRAFDGVKNTRPDGILHITTGAGGKALYEPDFTDNPQRWLHPEDQNIAYVARFYSERHSLTVIDLDGDTLILTQVNEAGEQVDRITVTKA